MNGQKRVADSLPQVAASHPFSANEQCSVLETEPYFPLEGPFGRISAGGLRIYQARNALLSEKVLSSAHA